MCGYQVREIATNFLVSVENESLPDDVEGAVTLGPIDDESQNETGLSFDVIVPMHCLTQVQDLYPGHLFRKSMSISKLPPNKATWPLIQMVLNLVSLCGAGWSGRLYSKLPLTAPLV